MTPRFGEELAQPDPITREVLIREDLQQELVAGFDILATGNAGTPAAAAGVTVRQTTVHGAVGSLPWMSLFGCRGSGDIPTPGIVDPPHAGELVLELLEDRSVAPCAGDENAGIVWSAFLGFDEPARTL